MRTICNTIVFVTLIFHCGCATAQTKKISAISPEVRQTYQLDDFYQKSITVHGFLIVSSDRISDYALLEAAYIIDQMAGNRPDILKTLTDHKIRCVVMACSEYTTDVPEHSELDKHMDKRARGLGATLDYPVISCGEENLLQYPGDPYYTENILIHEFAHTIHLGLRLMDPAFDEKLDNLHQSAMQKGLWKGTYAGSNHHEYWAEGVQSWFGTNRENDKVHNHVNTRQELIEYDPELGNLLEEVFTDRKWTYQPPKQRGYKNHLAGFELTPSMVFKWREPEADK